MTCLQCGASLSLGDAWCALCREPVPGVAHGPALRAALERQRLKRPEYSRWAGGPNSFGPVVKTAITIVVLAFAPLGVPTGETLLYLVAYLPIAALILWGTWRKERVR